MRTPRKYAPTSKPTQQYLSLLFDPLISRDSETFEWLPMIARQWEIRDLVTLKDGTKIEGRIREETDAEVKIPADVRAKIAEYAKYQAYLKARGKSQTASKGR